MPLIVKDNLPAIAWLRDENIFVASESEKKGSAPRTYRILLLNLMPKKEDTEMDFIRMLSNTPLTVELQLMRIENHVSKNTSKEHLNTYYKTFKELKNESFDGAIVTGAPVELLDFEEVHYWQELTTIFDWINEQIKTALFICWGAQAALHHFYQVRKILLPQKVFGVFEHHVRDIDHPLFRGFDDIFLVPHSRNSEFSKEDVLACADLIVEVESPQAGLHLVSSKTKNFFFISGHHEYDRHALDEEYRRDLAENLPINLPINYYYNDDLHQGPKVLWYAHALLLFQNWFTLYIGNEDTK